MGHPYTVVVSRAAVHRIIGPEADACLHRPQSLIAIDDSLICSRRQERLLHEVLHALFEHTGLTQCLIERRRLTEEELIYRLSPALYQFLRDNPEFFKIAGQS